MQRSTIVTGGSGQVGTWLLPRLVSRGDRIAAFSRGMKPQVDLGSGARWYSIDLADQDQRLPQIVADTLYHTTRIWLLPKWIERFADLGVRRIVAFSSTSRLTKAGSTNACDRELSRTLQEAEDAASERSDYCGIPLTILRPAITYGGKLGDRSIGDIARMIKRFGLFPIVGGGHGMRQPVHADDLAIAAIAAAEHSALPDEAYNLGGGERLTYARMVEGIFEAMGRRSRLVPVPLSAFRAAIHAARLLPSYRHLTTEIGDRMNQDLVFDTGIADAAFGYRPRPFQPDTSLYGVSSRKA